MSARTTRSVRTRAGGAALVVALLAGTAACGSDGSDPVADAVATSAVPSTPAFDAVATFDRASAATAEHETVSVVSTSMLAGQTVTMNMVTSTAGDQVQFQATVDAAGTEMEMRMVDRVLYFRTAELGQRWVRASIDDPTGPFAELADVFDAANSASDPAGELTALKLAEDVEVVGTEQLDGVETTHYRGTVKVEDAVAAMPKALRKQYRELATNGVETYTFDTWIGSDDLPRKTEVLMEVKGQPVLTRMEFSGWGADVRVVPPPARSVVDLDQLAGLTG